MGSRGSRGTCRGWAWSRCSTVPPRSSPRSPRRSPARYRRRSATAPRCVRAACASVCQRMAACCGRRAPAAGATTERTRLRPPSSRHRPAPGPAAGGGVPGAAAPFAEIGQGQPPSQGSHCATRWQKSASGSPRRRDQRPGASASADGGRLLRVRRRRRPGQRPRLAAHVDTNLLAARCSSRAWHCAGRDVAAQHAHAAVAAFHAVATRRVAALHAAQQQERPAATLAGAAGEEWDQAGTSGGTGARESGGGGGRSRWRRLGRRVRDVWL